MIVERAVLHQLPQRAFASSTPFRIESRRVTCHRASRRRPDLWQSCQRAFARVDLGQHLIGVGHGGVQIVIERIVLQQLSCAALALVERGRDFIQPVDGRVGAGVERVVVDQLAQRAFAPATALVMVSRSVAMVVIFLPNSGR